MIADKKRRLLYNRRLAPDTFVFFFHRGPGETSWSVRDYSAAGAVRLRDSSDFIDASGTVPEASEIRCSAEYDFETERHSTKDLDYWHRAIQAKNDQYLNRGSTPMPGSPPPASTFAVLNLPKLLASPKARKRGDIDRILHSPNSEDYVTWNFFQLLEAIPASRWWPSLLKLAGAASVDTADLPSVRLWQTVPAPPAYEGLSRERMRIAGSPAWRKRCLEGLRSRAPLKSISPLRAGTS